MVFDYTRKHVVHTTGATLVDSPRRVHPRLSHVHNIGNNPSGTAL